MLSTTAIVHLIYIIAKSAASMYDRMMTVRRVLSALCGERIHSNGLRFDRIADVSVIILLVIFHALAQVWPIHTVAEAEPQPLSSTSDTCAAYGPIASPLDLQQTTYGGYVVARYTFAPASRYSPFVVKLSSTGQIQWQHVFVDPNSQYSAAYAVRQTPDGGYVVAGEIYYNQILVFKLDSTGTLLWQHVYAIGTDSYAETLGLTSDGGFILGGLVSTSTATSYSSSVLLL